MISSADKRPDWDHRLAQIIDCLDCDELPSQMITGLSALVSFSMATVIINRGKSRPICIFENFPTAVGKAGIDNYIGGTYVLNPFYRAHLNGIKQGVYRIGDLAPDGYFSSGITETHKVIAALDEEIGYMTESWPKGFEELDLAVPVGDVTIEIGLYKSSECGGFKEDDIEMLVSQMPVVGAIIRKYWQLRSETLSLNPRDTSINDFYDNFGVSELSEREREVILYVLRGHSSESISINLDISITTVKTHRKRAYAKLDISSQSELFALFLNSLKSSLS